MARQSEQDPGAPAVFERSPLYAVLFATEADPTITQLPIVTVPRGGGEPIGTMPHSFDKEVAAALPGLWYCLHLPNTFRELTDIPATTLKASQALQLDHRILLAPIQAFNKEIFPRWDPLTAPTLVICPDELLDESAERAVLMGFSLPAVGYSMLSDQSLKEHWRAIHARYARDSPYLGREPTLTRRLDMASTDLPRRWIARQMTDDPSVLSPSEAGPIDIMDLAVTNQILLSSISKLESDGATPQAASDKFPEVVEEKRTQARFPVSLALPGVAPAYIRELYTPSARRNIKPITMTEDIDIWATNISERSDYLVERAAIEFVTAHQAIARSGVGLMLGNISREAFTILAQIERHFIDGPNGATVWRLLDRLSKTTASLWNDAVKLSVSHASMLTVFSNFPVGLLRFPGDSTCLSSRVPIAYRPLLPLTRTVQNELSHIPLHSLKGNLHILIAECVPDDDIVGRNSRIGWKYVEDMLRAQGRGITIEIVETSSIDALRTALKNSAPNIVVISAHGRFDPRSNVAGLMIGDEFYLGPEIDSLPAVVILSACHVAPRGASTVSVTDLMLREGAIAVLGTQVPVDVRRNSMLMMRFFLYISEVLAGHEKYANLLEVWNFAQMSNAVNDILSGSPALESWGRSTGPSGTSVITEFMQRRAPGRLRYGHIYRDSEDLLAEIAADQGIGDRVRNWFRFPGYVPESLFYVFAGCPERIYLRPPHEIAMEIASSQ